MHEGRRDIFPQCLSGVFSRLGSSSAPQARNSDVPLRVTCCLGAAEALFAILRCSLPLPNPHSHPLPQSAHRPPLDPTAIPHLRGSGASSRALPPVAAGLRHAPSIRSWPHMPPRYHCCCRRPGHGPKNKYIGARPPCRQAVSTHRAASRCTATPPSPRFRPHQHSASSACAI